MSVMVITITSSKYLIRYLHINWVANQVFNTSNSNVLGSHVHVNVCISVLVLVRIVLGDLHCLQVLCDYLMCLCT